MGHRVPGRPVAALPQLLPPHLHQHPRDGPRHRIRNPADEPRSTVAPPTWATRRTPSCSWCCSSTASPHELESERIRAGEISLADKRAVLQEIWASAPPTRQGLRRLPAAGRADGAVRLHRQPLGQPDPQHLVVRHHLLRPLPGRHFGIHRRGDPQRVPWTVVLPADPRLGQPDRGRLFHVLSGSLSFQIEHHLFPDLPARRYAEIAPQVREICARWGSPATRARCPSSSPPWCGRSSGWRCRGARPSVPPRPPGRLEPAAERRRVVVIGPVERNMSTFETGNRHR